jgi:hypothetical protein
MMENEILPAVKGSHLTVLDLKALDIKVLYHVSSALKVTGLRLGLEVLQAVERYILCKLAH